jgi:transposase-like protein
MKLKAIEKQRGDLHQIIPPLVNEYGQHKAAEILGVSVSTINKWLKDNHYQMVVTYQLTEAGRAAMHGPGVYEVPA